jgi:hypothetical protein
MAHSHSEETITVLPPDKERIKKLWHRCCYTWNHHLQLNLRLRSWFRMI